MTSAAFRFEPEAHRYYLGNRELLSVTTVLRDVGLIDPQWFTEEARLRGEYVHTCVALHHEGTLDNATVDPMIEPYFAGYLLFLAETGFAPELVEEQVHNEALGLAGTLDLLGRLPAHPPGSKDLIDVKSGHIPPTVGLQLAGYVRCLPPGAYRRWCLNLPGDGTYRLDRCADRKDDGVFLAALQVAQFKRGLR